MIILTSILDPHSPQAESIYRLTNYFFIGAAFILLLVSVLTIVFLYRYRAKPDDKEPEQLKRSFKVELLMTGVPLGMVIFFFILTLKTMKDVLPPPGNTEPEVIITGHQWWWEVNYPASGASTANEVHLPAGRKILIRFLSSDVIHSWWVPQLGNKMDVIPGMKTHLWLSINDTGYYEGACSEFCGQQHAWMRIQVYADEEQKYRDWLKHHHTFSVPPADSLAQKGYQLFASKTCSNCHTIGGTAFHGTTGPELTHFASRRTILSGMLPNNESNLKKWLAHPKEVKQGAYMPDFFLDKNSIDALTAYLMQLK